MGVQRSSEGATAHEIIEGVRVQLLMNICSGNVDVEKLMIGGSSTR